MTCSWKRAQKKRAVALHPKGPPPSFERPPAVVWIDAGSEGEADEEEKSGWVKRGAKQG